MPLSAQLERDETINAAPDSLAAAYISDFPRVADFYTGDYRTLNSIAAYASGLLRDGALKKLDASRGELSKALVKYMRPLGAPKPALDAAKRLAKQNVLCVVAGQQCGLAGGPAYTLYKAAHAVKLAQELTAAGIETVPVFWVASEDHDADEANRFVAIEQNSGGRRRIRTVRLPGVQSGGLAPMESIMLPAWPETRDETEGTPQSVAALSDIERLIGTGRARDEAVALAREFFSARTAGSKAKARTAAMGEGMARMLLRLFGEHGLIVIEPRVLRPLAPYKRVLAAEISGYAQSRAAVDAQLVEQRIRGFLPTLPDTPYLNFFVITRGLRRHVQAVNGELAIDGTREPVSVDGMLKLLERSPKRFSSGVRLRPIVQGACLPTCASIVGPGEIAYHGALKVMFERHHVPMPVLVPRWSFLLGGEGLPAAQVRNIAGDSIQRARQAAAAVAEAEAEMHGIFDNLRGGLGALAAPLDNDVQRLRGRIDKALHELRGRTLAAPLNRHGVADTVRDAAAWMLPGNQPQERQLSWLSFWPRWADELRRQFESRPATDYALGVLDNS